MKAQRGSTVFLYTLQLGTELGCVVNATHRPLYPRERDLVFILQESGWAQSRSGRM